MRLDFAARPPARVIITIVAVSIAASALGALYGDRKQKREAAAWLAFKTARHCRAVAHKESVTTTSRTSTSKGPDQISVNTVPAQTGWLCDDGVTYFKNDE